MHCSDSFVKSAVSVTYRRGETDHGRERVLFVLPGGRWEDAEETLRCSMNVCVRPMMASVERRVMVSKHLHCGNRENCCVAVLEVEEQDVNH